MSAKLLERIREVKRNHANQGTYQINTRIYDRSTNNSGAGSWLMVVGTGLLASSGVGATRHVASLLWDATVTKQLVPCVFHRLLDPRFSVILGDERNIPGNISTGAQFEDAFSIDVNRHRVNFRMVTLRLTEF